MKKVKQPGTQETMKQEHGQQQAKKSSANSRRTSSDWSRSVHDATQCDQAAKISAGAEVPGDVKTDPQGENVDEKEVR